MTVIEPVTLAEEFVYDLLSGSPQVKAQAKGGIHPSYAPTTVASPFIVHDIAGGDQVSPVGASAPSLFTVLWDVTAWTKGQGRIQARPLMTAALGALLGEEMAGLGQVPWQANDGTQAYMQAVYVGPIAPPAVPPGMGEGPWTRIAHRFRIELQIV